MRLPRKHDWLNDAIENLDEHFQLHKQDVALSFASLTKAQLEFITQEVDLCETNSRYYLENYHVIQTKDSGFRCLYPFHESQEIFYAVIVTIQVNGKPVKVVVLKARQEGISTISQGLLFHKTIFTEGCTSMVVAQDPDQSVYLANKSRLAYDWLPWWMRPEVRYDEKAKTLSFDRKDPNDRFSNPGLKSEILVDAANKLSGVGIGRTIRAFHGSEIAKWPDDPQVLTKYIYPTLNASDELAIMEFTAYGREHFSYDLWRAAEDGAGDWTPIFIEFFRVKDYSLPIPEGERFVRTVQEAEIAERVLTDTGVSLTDEQIHWRRKKIDETKRTTGSEWGFYESYPINALQAFQASGTCAFDKHKLNRMLINRSAEPKWFGKVGLEYDQRNNRWTPQIELKPVQKGEKAPSQSEYGCQFYVWDLPDPRHGYYVAGDPSMGISDGGDPAAMQVFKIGRGKAPDEQVAEWHGFLSPSAFAQAVYAVAKYYLGAEVAIECNGEVGTMCNNELMRVLGYDRIFQWKHYDKIKNYVSDFVGWWTNQNTRPKIVTKMREAIDSDGIILRSAALIDEMMAFSSVKGKSYRGLGSADDRVMSACICYWCAHDSDWAVEVASTPIDDSKVFGFVCSYEVSHNWPNKQMALSEGAMPLTMTAKRVVSGVGLSCPVCRIENRESELRFIPKKDFSNSEFSPVHDAPNGVRASMMNRGIPVHDIWPDEVSSGLPPTAEDAWKIL